MLGAVVETLARPARRANANLHFSRSSSNDSGRQLHDLRSKGGICSSACVAPTIHRSSLELAPWFGAKLSKKIGFFETIKFYVEIKSSTSLAPKMFLQSRLDLAACSVCCLKVRGCETVRCHGRSNILGPPSSSLEKGRNHVECSNTFHTLLSFLPISFCGAGVFEALRAFVCSRYLLIDT